MAAAHGQIWLTGTGTTKQQVAGCTGVLAHTGWVRSCCLVGVRLCRQLLPPSLTSSLALRALRPSTRKRKYSSRPTYSAPDSVLTMPSPREESYLRPSSASAFGTGGRVLTSRSSSQSSRNHQQWLLLLLLFVLLMLVLACWWS